MVVTVFDLQRQSQPLRPFFAWYYSGRVNSLSTYLGNNAVLSGTHNFSVQPLGGAADQFRIGSHYLNNSLASISSRFLKPLRRRNQSRVCQSHSFNGYAEHGNSAAVDTDGYVFQGDV